MVRPGWRCGLDHRIQQRQLVRVSPVNLIRVNCGICGAYHWQCPFIQASASAIKITVEAHDLNEVVDLIIRHLDADGNGQISLDEFIAINVEYPLLAHTMGARGM